MSSSEDEKENASLVAEWKEQSDQLEPTGSHVYILTLATHSHSSDGDEAAEFIGAFNSKAAAVAKSVTVWTPWGTFDEAKEDMGDDKDNRKNPPDNGILFQVGGEDIGEGDYCRLLINKQPIVGLTEQLGSSQQNKAKRKKGTKRKK